VEMGMIYPIDLERRTNKYVLREYHLPRRLCQVKNDSLPG